MWQHVKLSEQIRPWDTLACCWDVKQATNNNIPARRGDRGQALDLDVSVSFLLCWSVCQSVGWPTPSNWTEEEAREYCERMLDGVQELRLCNGIVLSANATYSYTDLTDICVDNIRVRTSAIGRYSTIRALNVALYPLRQCHIFLYWPHWHLCRQHQGKNICYRTVFYYQSIKCCIVSSPPMPHIPILTSLTSVSTTSG